MVEKSVKPDITNEKARDYLLMPYLILNVVNYLFKMVFIGEEYFGLRFLTPTWGLWYLLALFFWKYFLKDLVKIRFLRILRIDHIAIYYILF